MRLNLHGDGMDELAARILSFATVPLWAVTLYVVARYISPLVHARNERVRISVEEKAADWTQLRQEVQDARKETQSVRDRLNEEVERADRRAATWAAEHDKCHRELAAVQGKLATEMAERLKMQKIIDGIGEIRQAQSTAVAEVRLDAIDRKRREKDDGEG